MAVILVACGDDESPISEDDVVGSTCANDYSLNTTNTVCNKTPTVSSQYSESVSNDIRTITTNRIPDHDYDNQVSNLGITGLTST